MDSVQKIDTAQRSTYKKLLTQIEVGYYSGHIRLNSVEFHCPEDVVEYPMEPVENIQISWKYAFEKTNDGFNSNVLIRNEITSDFNEDESIELEIGYNLYYGSKMDLPESLFKKFAYEKVLPQVWPYFREQARELYFKAGLKWVIIPFEPKAISE